jgi:hypothetical protein
MKRWRCGPHQPDTDTMPSRQPAHAIQSATRFQIGEQRMLLATIVLFGWTIRSIMHYYEVSGPWRTSFPNRQVRNLSNPRIQVSFFFTHGNSTFSSRIILLFALTYYNSSIILV